MVNCQLSTWLPETRLRYKAIFSTNAQLRLVNKHQDFVG